MKLPPLKVTMGEGIELWELRGVSALFGIPDDQTEELVARFGISPLEIGQYRMVEMGGLREAIHLVCQPGATLHFEPVPGARLTSKGLTALRNLSPFGEVTTTLKKAMTSQRLGMYLRSAHDHRDRDMKKAVSRLAELLDKRRGKGTVGEQTLDAPQKQEQDVAG